MLLIVRNVAVRLPSTEACHPSSVISVSGPGGVKLPPAFATRMSMGPRLLLDPETRGLEIDHPRRIPDDVNRPPTRALDLLLDRGQGLRIPTVDRDLRAFLSEQAGDRRTDAAGTARHEGDPAVQTLHTEDLDFSIRTR